MTGATGMIGSLILKNCLEDPSIRLVTSFSRNASGFSHEKLREIIHDDFEDYHNLEHYFRDQQIAFYCLGVYTGQVKEAEFKKITVDFTGVFAETLKRNSPDATFCFLSGQGADTREKSRLSFAKYKGMAENILSRLKFGRLHIFRPAYIYPVKPRKEPNFGYRIMRWLYPAFKKISPGSAITSQQLADAIFHLGMKDISDKQVLENADILDLEV